MQKLRLYSSMFSFTMFIFISIIVTNDYVKQVDLTVISIVQEIESPAFTILFTTFTHLGSYIGMVFIFLILISIFFKLKTYQREIIALSIIVATTPIINLLLKKLFQRPRPEIHRLIDIGGFSFPSGHAMYATSLYGMIIVLLWNRLRSAKHRLLLVTINVTIIFLITTSRIYLGVHYPSDILGGIFASIVLITIITKISLIRFGTK